MLYQQYLIRERERGACFAAFKNNIWVGFAVFCGTVVELVILPSTLSDGALRTTANLIDQMNAGLARAIRWLCLIMVVVTLLVVVLRYGFDVGAIALQESVMYMHGLVFLLGIPYGIAQNTHVRVDIAHGRLSERWRHRIELAGATRSSCCRSRLHLRHEPPLCRRKLACPGRQSRSWGYSRDFSVEIPHTP